MSNRNALSCISFYRSAYYIRMELYIARRFIPPRQSMSVDPPRSQTTGANLLSFSKNKNNKISNNIKRDCVFVCYLFIIIYLFFYFAQESGDPPEMWNRRTVLLMLSSHFVHIIRGSVGQECKLRRQDEEELNIQKRKRKRSCVRH